MKTTYEIGLVDEGSSKAKHAEKFVDAKGIASTFATEHKGHPVGIYGGKTPRYVLCERDQVVTIASERAYAIVETIRANKRAA